MCEPVRESDRLCVKVCEDGMKTCGRERGGSSRCREACGIILWGLIPGGGNVIGALPDDVCSKQHLM